MGGWAAGLMAYGLLASGLLGLCGRGGRLPTALPTRLLTRLLTRLQNGDPGRGLGVGLLADLHHCKSCKCKNNHAIWVGGLGNVYVSVFEEHMRPWRCPSNHCHSCDHVESDTFAVTVTITFAAHTHTQRRLRMQLLLFMFLILLLLLLVITFLHPSLHIRCVFSLRFPM